MAMRGIFSSLARRGRTSLPQIGLANIRPSDPTLLRDLSSGAGRSGRPQLPPTSFRAFKPATVLSTSSLATTAPGMGAASRPMADQHCFSASAKSCDAGEVGLSWIPNVSGTNLISGPGVKSLCTSVPANGFTTRSVSLAADVAPKPTASLFQSVQTGKASVVCSSSASKSIPLRCLSTAGAAGSGLMRYLPRGYPGSHRPFRSFIVVCAVGGVIVGVVAFVLVPDEIFPDAVDWSKGPAFPEPVDASYNTDCGSCWAVASVQSVMAVFAIETGVVCNFSCQQVIDHAVRNGCKGGQIPLAYEFMKLFGLAREKDYPKSEFPGKMNVPIAVTLAEFKVIDPTETDFMRALQVSPIAVNLNINEAFCFYRKGQILELEDCPPCSVKKGSGHCAVLVGYGVTKDGKKFWKLMNTWGKKWGDGGYFYLRRGTSNPKGVAGITEFSAYKPVLSY